MASDDKTVRQRVASCFSVKELVPAVFRSSLMSHLLMCTIGEVTVFLLLAQYVSDGTLYKHAPDIVMIGISVIELISAPFTSWLGYTRRRRTILFWVFGAGICLIPVAFVGTATSVDNKGPELCYVNASNSTINTDNTSNVLVSVYVFVLVVAGLACAVSRVAALSHGVAYLDEHETSNMSMHFGILVLARVLGLLVAPIMVKALTKSSLRLFLHISFLTINCAYGALKMLRFPINAPESEESKKIIMEKRDFLSSLCRVLSSKLAMVQAFSMALLTTALWGFGINETRIIKTHYHIVEEENWMVMYSVILRYHIPVVMVVFFGLLYTKPIIDRFDRVKSLGMITFGSVVFGIYLAIVLMLRCDKGTVSGLTEDNYTQPMCSLGCGCKSSSNEFSPVCIQDQMISYYSPCHAGCTVYEDKYGIKSLTNCTCAMISGRATFGACSKSNCISPLELHKLLYLIIVIFTLLALQQQGVLLLRSVDPRDRSVALGVSSTIISLFTFIGGHSLYNWMRSVTCAVSVDGQCHLQNSVFPYIVGGTSAGLGLISFIVNLVIWIVLKRQQKRNQNEE